jgi:hypothetical protein
VRESGASQNPGNLEPAGHGRRLKQDIPSALEQPGTRSVHGHDGNRSPRRLSKPLWFVKMMTGGGPTCPLILRPWLRRRPEVIRQHGPLVRDRLPNLLEGEPNGTCQVNPLELGTLEVGLPGEGLLPVDMNPPPKVTIPRETLSSKQQPASHGSRTVSRIILAIPIASRG